MGKTVSDILIDVLEDLSEADFKKFRNKLCDRKAEPKIRFGKVEKADHIDLVSILIQTFTENGALDVAIEVLNAISVQKGANELVEYKTSLQMALPHTEPGCNSSSAGLKDPFVDIHRKDLIDRVSQVEPILDSLLQRKLITQEAYSEVRSERTSQKRMRALYDGPVKGFGCSGKEIFLEILKEHEPFLIKDLEGEK